MDERLFSEAELERLTGLKPRFWQQARSQGTGPTFIKISSRCIRYRWADVRAWLDARAVG